MAKGHRERLMNKVLDNGIDILYEHEFLELCLFFAFPQINTNTLAHSLIDKFGDLESVCTAPIKEITKVEGIGPSAARIIKLIPQISRGYALHTSIKDKTRYTSRESICKKCVSLFKEKKEENAYLLCFNKLMYLIKEVKLAEGNPGSVNIEPRKITQAVANSSATSFVLCHNHPSGNLLPSQSDIMVTEAMSNIANIMGVEFIDHIIVSGDKYVSCKVI